MCHFEYRVSCGGKPHDRRRPRVVPVMSSLLTGRVSRPKMDALVAADERFTDPNFATAETNVLS
jgi:hypothetical protein